MRVEIAQRSKAVRVESSKPSEPHHTQKQTDHPGG